MGRCRHGRDLVQEYFDIFNAEARQFFDPLSSDHYDLRGSHVHIDSKVKRLEESITQDDLDDDSDDGDINGDIDWCNAQDDDLSGYQNIDSTYKAADDNEKGKKADSAANNATPMGCYWHPSEKAIFFHCLSRYSIHRLDQWRENLPSKSKFEILVYYDVLSKNLARLKRSNMKGFGGILSRQELPIAYEVDDIFVSFEESMSRTIRPETEPLPEVSNGGTNEDECLISIDNWNKRWKPIYSKTNVQELIPTCKEALPFSDKAMHFLIECCKTYTRKLVQSVILLGFEEKSVCKAALFEGNVHTDSHNDDLVVNKSAKPNLFPQIVTKEHVRRAISQLKFEGHDVPTLGDTVVRSLKKFELETDNKGKLFRTNDVTMSLLPTLLHNASMPTTFLQDPMTTQSFVEGQYDIDMAIANKLYKMNGGKTQKRRKLAQYCDEGFIVDDNLNRIDNPLEFQLCDWETDRMDANDSHKSRLHQHILLDYFLGADQTHDSNIQLKRQHLIENESLSGITSQLSASTINRFLHTNT